MKQNAIGVFYRHSPRGAKELAFAVDSLRLLGAEKLVLFLQRDPVYAQIMPDCDFDGVQRDLLLRLALASYPDLTKEKLEIRFFEANEDRQKLVDGLLMLVDRRPDFHCAELYTPVMIPQDELGFCARGSGSLVIPFGDGSSAFRAVRLALPLAAKLSLRIVLYHTTWHDPEVSSSEPMDHLSAGARETKAALERMITESGQQHETIVEATDDTVEGIVQCAMRNQARLIVMARRLKPGIGCYVHRAQIKSPVPLLIADDGGQRRAA